MGQWKEKFSRFMIGRYGTDELNKGLMYLAIGCIVLSLVGIDYAYWIGIFLTILIYVRTFSKNILKRREENIWFYQKRDKVRKWYKNKQSILEQKKKFKIFICPKCKQKIRVPRGRGKIEIRCGKCSHSFIKKS